MNVHAGSAVGEHPVLSTIDAALRHFDRVLTKSTDRADLVAWKQELHRLRQERLRPLNSSIALMGESGSGKSSLINALLGMDLLPHDAGSPVTAVVTEIRHVQGKFRVLAELEDRASFLARFASVCQRLREAWDQQNDEDGTPAEQAMDAADVSLLSAVVGMDPTKLFQLAEVGKEDAFLHAEVDEVLQRGAKRDWAFAENDIDGLRNRCNACLSSRRPLWPLVRRVTIEGPFPLLASGLCLVDVPGLNDPDPIRDGVAQDALQNAQLIWLVLSAKRAMTGALVQFLADSHLLTRLQVEGRLASLVAIATHADQLDESGLIQEYEPEGEPGLDELLQLHRKRVGHEVRRLILRVWGENVAAARGDVNSETAVAGRQLIKDMPFFSVSSTDSLLHRGIVRSRKHPMFDRDEQTGIPELAEWIKEDFVAREQAAHRARLDRQANQLAASIRSTLTHKETVNRNVAKLGDVKKGGLSGLQNRARTFLETRLQEHKHDAEKATEAQTRRVISAIHAGIEDAVEEIEQVVPERLAGIHWATLRAICRRNGMFHGSTQRWDLPAEIGDKVTKRVAFRWSELFEVASRSFLDDIMQKSADLLAVHTEFLHAMIVREVGEAAPGIERLKHPTRRLDFELEKIRAAIMEQLQKARMCFERDLINTLRHGLTPAFEAAAQERGAGMKRRMVAAICRGLGVETPSLLPKLARDLEDKVAEVNVILRDHVSTAHEAIRRAAKIESENMEVALFESTPEELLKVADQIAFGLRSLDAA